MKRIVYTRADDGGISIVIPASKKSIEVQQGSLTEEQYKSHVWGKGVPDDAVKPRELDIADYPVDSESKVTRELRNAWVDVTPESRIDIDCTKAKDIRVGNLRIVRDKMLKESDVEITRALELGDQAKINELKVYRQGLRDATEPLKALNTYGKVNDVTLLQQMKEMSLAL